MKIRSDFVTNSSSVSYIVTMHKKIVDLFDRYYGGHTKLEERVIRDTVKKEVQEKGTRVYLEGEEMFVKKYTFNDDDGVTVDKHLLQDEGTQLDFENISDKDLWNYIRGEYLINGELSQIRGFGVTQVDTY